MVYRKWKYLFCNLNMVSNEFINILFKCICVLKRD